MAGATVCASLATRGSRLEADKNVQKFTIVMFTPDIGVLSIRLCSDEAWCLQFSATTTGKALLTDPSTTGLPQ